LSVDWNAFTPGAALAGGALIGVATGLLVLLAGRIAGVSGVLGELLRAGPGDRAWRLAFVAGLLAAPWLGSLAGAPPAGILDANLGTLVASGLLVGVGARYGGGCTSGHGVCGLSRLSVRSLVATLCFMATGFATVYLVRHLWPA
jgi:hypothetical protein